MLSRGIGVGVILGALVLVAALWFLHSSADDPVLIAAVGDTSGYRVLDEAGAPADPLEAVRPLLNESDVFVFNYEGVILSELPEPGDCPARPDQSTFHTSTPIADHLRLAPVAVATLANNHVLDCGERGIGDTLREFDASGIHAVGAGASIELACRPLVLEQGGRKLAFLAYLAWPGNEMCASGDSAGAACFETCSGEQRIASLAESGHSVIVSLHLHLAESWTQRAHELHIGLVRDVLEAGADIVIGHGPHMPQGVFEHEHGIGLPSLGNFLFSTDYQMPRSAHRSVVAQVAIGDGFQSMSLYPIEIGGDGIPYPAPPHAAAGILNNIIWLSEPFETRFRIIRTDESVRAELRRQDGVYSSPMTRYPKP
ncbi:CapA family protein [Wenzhouxiangella sp. EGI_FJ10305]|uniref:CapA family protein n=1 Tax=Wenzhouxiangella sp. EGI_FJ10305 TaxID=3243768 RepID=UPI0035DB0BAD